MSLNTQAKQEINELLKSLKYHESKIDMCIQYERPEEELDFHLKQHASYLNWIDGMLDEVWYRNLDRKVQQSVNYYRKKAGLKTQKVTAYI